MLKSSEFLHRLDKHFLKDKMEKCLACKSNDCLKIINQIIMINKCENCHAMFLEKEYQQSKIEPEQKVSRIKARGH